MSEFGDFDALGLAELVRRGQVSAGELLDDAIARVGQVNDELNAVVTRMYDEAHAAIGNGLRGPFAGVPFLLKDLRAQYEGVPTTSGSRLMREHVATQDSELVKRYKTAGFVIFGKTNTSEFGCCPSTEGGLFGATRNPWNPEKSAGGSSGGTACAVAARIVPAGHGSDGGGSIRIPASCCGVFGFKPSRGVNPAGPVLGEAWNGLSAEHVLTKSVRDSAAILDVTAGPAPGDPYCGPTFDMPLLQCLDGPLGKLRVAVQREPASGAPVHSDCIAAVDDAAALLEDLGHLVEEARPVYDTERFGAAYPLIIAANVQAAIDEYMEEAGVESPDGLLDNVIAILARMGHESTAADMARAVWSMHKVGREVAPFFEEYDVLLSPVVATPPPAIGTLDTSTDDVDAYLGAVFAFIPFTALANMAGTPAMSIPLSWNQSGLPIGVHFGAGFGRDPLLFRLAAQLEQARPWAGKTPPNCAR